MNGVWFLLGGAALGAAITVLIYGANVEGDGEMQGGGNVEEVVGRKSVRESQRSSVRSGAAFEGEDGVDWGEGFERPVTDSEGYERFDMTNASERDIVISYWYGSMYGITDFLEAETGRDFDLGGKVQSSTNDYFMP